MSTMRSKSRSSMHSPRTKSLGSPPLRHCLDLGGGAASCEVCEDLGFQGGPFIATILSGLSHAGGLDSQEVQLVAMCVSVCENPWPPRCTLRSITLVKVSWAQSGSFAQHLDSKKVGHYFGDP
mmetsp:Transcript_28583/g.91891  ORF Transcript_28583/g.91891 Transcript_28583/m.91891 type:complete len:123 (-) Transcript_28583:34-402(-)